MQGVDSLLFLALFAAAFWLLLIRPQRRRQRQLVDLQHAVKPGDEVMLSAGVFARVTGEVDDPAAGDCLLVELAPGVEVKIARGAVMRTVHAPVEETETPEAAAADPVDPTDDSRGV